MLAGPIYRYKGWAITYHPGRPVDNRYRAYGNGMVLRAKDSSSIRRLIDQYERH